MKLSTTRWTVGYAFAVLIVAAGGGAHAQPAPTTKPAKPAVAKVTITAQTLLVAEIATGAALPAGLSAQQRAAAAGVVAKLKAKQNDQARLALEQLVSEFVASYKVSVGALAACKQAKQPEGTCKREGYLAAAIELINWVLRETYLESTSDLRLVVDYVRHINEQKKAIREHLTELRTARGKPGKDKLAVSVPKLLPRVKGKPSVTISAKLVPRGELDALIAEWERKLSSADDDQQLANIDLQKALQKQQQTLQTLSNVSKMLHDTAMGIIRKIG